MNSRAVSTLAIVALCLVYGCLGDDDEGPPCGEFTRITNEHALGGVPVASIDIHSCQNQCMENSDCVAVDYDRLPMPYLSHCWLHLSAVQSTQPHLNVDHYTYDRC